MASLEFLADHKLYLYSKLQFKPSYGWIINPSLQSTDLRGNHDKAVLSSICQL